MTESFALVLLPLSKSLFVLADEQKTENTLRTLQSAFVKNKNDDQECNGQAEQSGRERNLKRRARQRRSRGPCLLSLLPWNIFGHTALSGTEYSRRERP